MFWKRSWKHRTTHFKSSARFAGRRKRFDTGRMRLQDFAQNCWQAWVEMRGTARTCPVWQARHLVNLDQGCLHTGPVSSVTQSLYRDHGISVERLLDSRDPVNSSKQSLCRSCTKIPWLLLEDFLMETLWISLRDPRTEEILWVLCQRSYGFLSQIFVPDLEGSYCTSPRCLGSPARIIL